MHVKRTHVIFFTRIYQVNLRMLTKDEKLFMEYWEKNRDRDKKFIRQLAMGLPIGLIFSLPILLAVIFDDWYKNMIYISSSQLIVIIIGVFFIAVFFAVFRNRFKWENNEQLYKELKFKERQDNAAH
jgi:pilus assembly protein TadC